MNMLASPPRTHQADPEEVRSWKAVVGKKTAEFLHIFVSPKAGVTQDQLEDKLSLAVDWLRYGEGVYVVYTTSDVDTWKRRLIEFVKPDGCLFICKLDIKKRQGWMMKDFWEGIKEKTAAGKGESR